MSSGDEELRRLHAEAYAAWRRGRRRAWLLLAANMAGGAGAALGGRLLAERMHVHVPAWAGVALLCLLAAGLGLRHRYLARRGRG